MVIRMAIGKDFDRMNDQCAYFRLQELVWYAGGHFPDLYPIQREMCINSRTYFIMEVW